MNHIESKLRGTFGFCCLVGFIPPIDSRFCRCVINSSIRYVAWCVLFILSSMALLACLPAILVVWNNNNNKSVSTILYLYNNHVIVLPMGLLLLMEMNEQEQDQECSWTKFIVCVCAKFDTWIQIEYWKWLKKMNRVTITITDTIVLVFGVGGVGSVSLMMHCERHEIHEQE